LTEALQDYLHAIGQGDRRVSVYLKSWVLLNHAERKSEADDLLRRMPNAFLSSDLQKMAAEASLRNGEAQRALNLMNRAAVAESKNYQDHLLRAQILNTAGQKDKAAESIAKAKKEAAESIAKAKKFAGTSGEAWLALVQYHVGLSQKKEAEDTIGEAQEQLRGPEAPLYLALCYEAVGDKDQAEKAYAAAVAAAPNDAKPLRMRAAFYKRFGARAKSIATLRQILALKPSPEEAAWVRRALALTLGTGTAQAEFQMALELLEQNLKTEETSNPDDLLAKAEIYATRPTHFREALAIMQKMDKKLPLSPPAKFFLARLYAGDGKHEETERVMVDLLTQAPTNTDYLRFLVTQLLRHNAPEAEVWLRKLEALAPDDPASVGLRAAALVKEGKAFEAVEKVDQFAQAGRKTQAERADWLRQAIGLLEPLGGESPQAADVIWPAAEKRCEQLLQISTDPHDALLFAAYLGRRHRVAEALKLIERAKATCPALEVAQIATVIVCTAPATDEQLVTVEKYVGDLAGQKDGAAARPLLGMVQARRGHYAAAEASFRAALALDVGNCNLLNNLAFMLVLQKQPSEEALKLVEAAIESVGPTAELLDTRGMAYLQKGQTDLAIKDLSQAVDLGPGRVRYMHLAQAYLQARQRDDATRTFAKVRGVDAERSLFMPDEVRLYRDLSTTLAGP
jgi:tetratricopeptide (TPR) repeat protein